MSDWMGIVWLVVLLIGNAFFVGAEFAVMTARRSQIEPKADAGKASARTALYAMEHVSLMLAVCQLGITVCSLLILNIAEPAIHHLIGEPLHMLGVPAGIAGPASFIFALLVVTFLHVTFGEMVPKNISVSVADRSVMLLAPPLVALSKLVYPVVVSLNWLANHVLRAMRVEPKDEVTSSFTLEEVQNIVAESRKEGLVDDESGIISGALEFSEYTAGTLMVPLDELVSLPPSTSPNEFERAVGRTGFSRFVMQDEDQALAGYLHLKDVMSIPPHRADDPIPVTRLRTLANLAADTEVEDALSVMQRTGSHLARVIDAEGATRGILFLEDVIEVLVGEIRDATQQQGLRRRNGQGNAGSAVTPA
ncbi:hemolysin family protein [Zhihengliuella halotolerans]|uniref:CBS domain containing-hemolysin-like protein n=1 Tax=Zhihengliuella halotolerans TaxID=370736 RepID=A0A4Q8ACA2_9MICC|nr:hemolysin family protein [Zhihengliuella halotolerans]RZU61694.1 CBS domain containing-hemolysin-like protein [Zhihengliuella halotolerans]